MPESPSPCTEVKTWIGRAPPPSRAVARRLGLSYEGVFRQASVANDMVPLYKQLRDGSRMLPDGLKYIDSWVEPNFSRCFQIIECDDLRLFQHWVLEWRGFGATLEIVPVVSSKETQVVVQPYLDRK